MVLLGPAAVAVASPSEGIHNIKHVVMIMQENRSFDSYFGTYPGANGIPAGVCVPDPAHGGCVKPYYEPLDKNFGGPHGAATAAKDIDGGRMDGFVAQVEHGLKCSGDNPDCSACSTTEGEAEEADPCLDVMGYHDARQLPNYWTYAQNYVLQDDMFESAASWSAPEHNFLVSAWSAVCPAGDSNPLDCVSSLTRSGPNRTWTDITYLLHRAQVSWRYYVFEGGEPDCEDDEAITCRPVRQSPKTPGIWNPLADFTDVKQDGQLEDIQSLTSFYTAVHDSSACGLANVSWIVPNQNVSEHPPALISKGQAYVTTLINSIMRSPCWDSTAIFLSWDDWGGFYDHVVPPSIDENGYGLRVPSLVISPYAKAGYIDHQQLSHDAYLKFIEDDFLDGQRLNPATDGRPDARPDVREEAPGLGDLASDFNFSQSPRPPLLLSTHPEPGPASQPPGGQRPPALEMGAASSVAQTSATLNATVNPDGVAVSACHFEYGTSTSYGSSVPCASLPGSGASPVAVSATAVGLSANVTYHMRIVATSAGGTSYGADLLFTTPAGPPVAVTGAASSVAQTSATLNATVNPDGAAVSDCHFEYGTSTSYGSSVPCASLPGSGSSPVAVSAAVAGLSANTTYHVRIVAINAGGTSYGTDATFTTLPNPPTVETGAASKVKRGSATLNATVNPNGRAVSDCHFEYGTSTSYGSSVPCASLPGSGSSPVVVSAAVAGLSASTTYHVRIVATNPGGTGYGADQTFTTP
ncbi:MAG: alkaline phosphatase family protein [Solirubrobacteraceae bacterium]